MLRLLYIPLVLIAATALATACATPDPPIATPTNAPPSPTPTPITTDGVLARSGEAMAELSSFHFQMAHEVGATEFVPGLRATDVSGDVQSPDRLYAEMKGLFAAFAVKIQFIAVGEDNFMTNPLAGTWDRIDTEVTPIGFFNPQQGISTMMVQVKEAAFMEPPTGGGRVFKIRGQMPAEALAPLLGDVVTGSQVAVELEIDRATSRLLKATFTGKVTPTDQDGTLRVVTLSKFNEPVSIEPPQ